MARHDAAPERPLPEVLAQLPGLLAEQSAIQQQQATRLAEINARLAADRKNRQERARIEKERLALLPEAENWERLNKLFGSADGQKFRRIAQGYTLRPSADLRQPSLAESVVAVYAATCSRTAGLAGGRQRYAGRGAQRAYTLGRGVVSHLTGSGLGLSSLSSYRMNIESLFIDEGFGSLDAETCARRWRLSNICRYRAAR